MVAVQLSFVALFLMSCAYAFLKGGRDGRWAASLLIGAVLLSNPASYMVADWGRTNLALFGVDVLLLIGLVALCNASDRYWPIWMVAFHGISVATHLTTMIDGAFLPGVYKALETFWSIPNQLVMAFGVMLDRRADKALALRAENGGERRAVSEPQSGRPS